ncbi:NAD(P)/FAD-dependent oxidoreductase [Rhodococcus sp. WS4]|nr:NAD(P)/FAD-dependent oxidoreductase [Rhodococcus sp. WS4]
MTMVESLDVQATEIFDRWLSRCRDAFESRDAAAMAGLFAEDGYWKDILSFTGGYRTFTGASAIREAFGAKAPDVQPHSIRPAAERTPPRFVRRSARDIIEAYFDFDTAIGRGTGFVRLLHDPRNPFEPAVWILLTTLQELDGHEERVGSHRPTGINYSQNFAGDNWLDERRAEVTFDNREPEVIVVGGGQSGLILGARLRQMGVDALIVEKNARVGDNWRQRYHSLTLHNEAWANSMPYMPFPPTWPTFIPKDKLAGWLEAYAEAMELNVWTSTELVNADYDEASARWTVQLRCADGVVRSKSAPHLVVAVGGSSSVPNKPTLPGLDGFEGEVIHSSEFTSGLSYAGKRVIVVGTGNSGHDVAQDLYSNGAAAVTMMQRNPTCVVSLVPSGTLVYSLYSEGPPVDDIDLITAAIPYEVLRETYQWLTRRTCDLDKDLIARLNAVGFETEYGEDGTGFHMKYLRSGGGYYINVGCSDLIADRKIGLVQAREMDQFVPEGLRMADGTLVEADLVVLATGYRNLQHGLSSLLGQEIADRVGPIWGFDENHVMRNMWQRTRQPGLWIMGGSLIDARLYSRFLALQITADLNSLALPGRD